jgi:hypothetical protein
MKRFALFSLLLLSCCSTAFAWSGEGHMVIAAIAFKELSPEAKTKVNALLKSHPDYSKWTNSFAGDFAGMDMETYVFLRASTWPDEIRRKKNSYDHPQWHYIDYPLRAPKFAMEEPAETGDDILVGLNESAKIVADAQAPAESRAAHLSWMIHLVGDIHQPLHCSSYFSKEFLKGDKGGNSFYVKPATASIKLHSLWDGLLGTRNEPRTALNEATRLRAAQPISYMRATELEPDFKAWSLEGRQLAIDKAYLKGKLKSAPAQSKSKSKKSKPTDITSILTEPDPEPAKPDDAKAGVLPKTYTKEAKKIAEQQARLAGYRLSTELETLVGRE